MPLVSVSTVRGASNAGPTASTVTPGSTAPEVSLTVPVIDACAKTSRGTRHSHASSASFLPRALISRLLDITNATERLQLVTPPQLVNDATDAVKEKIRWIRETDDGPFHEIGSGLSARGESQTGRHLFPTCASACYLAGLLKTAESTVTFVLRSLSFAVYRPSSQVNLYSNGNFTPSTSR